MAKKDKNTKPAPETAKSEFNIGGSYLPWTLNVFENDLEGFPEPERLPIAGDWVSYLAGMSVILAVVTHVDGAKVFIHDGNGAGRVLLQDIIEIR